MRGCLFLLLAVSAVPSLSQAASFPCAKASTPTEKAICADQPLSKLDERVSAAYREALKLLSGNSPEEGEGGAAVKAEQRVWLGERNACGADLACLRSTHERRLKRLGFAPDPATPTPADRYLGKFSDQDGNGGVIGFVALGLRNGKVAFNINGAEPTAGRWICDFSGIGSVDAGGRLIVGNPGAEGNGLILEAKGTTVAIVDNEANRAASSNWCGMNGSFLGSYRRRK